MRRIRKRWLWTKMGIRGICEDWLCTTVIHERLQGPQTCTLAPGKLATHRGFDFCPFFEAYELESGWWERG